MPPLPVDGFMFRLSHVGWSDRNVCCATIRVTIVDKAVRTTLLARPHDPVPDRGERELAELGLAVAIEQPQLRQIRWLNGRGGPELDDRDVERIRSSARGCEAFMQRPTHNLVQPAWLCRLFVVHVVEGDRDRSRFAKEAVGGGKKQRLAHERARAELIGSGAVRVPVRHERADVRMATIVRLTEGDCLGGACREGAQDHEHEPRD